MNWEEERTSGKLARALQRLWHDVALAELKLAHKKELPYNLNYQDNLYLNIIDCYPNKYTSSQIADLLQITRPSVTQKINELVKKGYILRTQSETDKRVFYLSINPDSPYHWEISKKQENTIEEAFIQKFNQEGLDIFIEMLGFVTEEYEPYLKGEKTNEDS